jgi:ubiquinone/menaquinone biosynthesis C-methylase UbiE
MVEDAREAYGKNVKWHQRRPEHAHQHVLSGIVTMANPDPKALVLDVATGTGNTANAFAPFVRRVIGIDISPEIVSEADELIRQNSVQNVDLCLADVMAMPFPDSTFDMVVSRGASHHFKDIKRALGEMSRVLKPGGVMAIEDRIVPEDEEVDRTMNMLHALQNRSHVRDYKPSDWKAMLSAAGLEPREIRTYARSLPLNKLTATAEADDAQEIVSHVNGFSDGLKEKFGYRMDSGVVHTNHWFLMLTAVKKISSSC